MKLVQKNSEQIKIEEELRLEREREEKQRSNFLRSLRINPLFQKYVIKEIFEKNLEQMTDIRTIPSDNYTNMGKLMVQAKAARTKLEQILKELMA